MLRPFGDVTVGPISDKPFPLRGFAFSGTRAAENYSTALLIG
jgi:hypothetical protein